MTIQVGDKLPSVTLFHKDADGVQKISSDELFGSGKTLLFGLPGAFTPTCSAAHVPGYIVHADAIHEKGVERIVCISVNDAHVMQAWGENQNVEDRVMMISDGNAEFTRAVGLELDRHAAGMGIRSQRYAMLIEDGVVKLLNVEQDGKFEVSDAETLLAAL